MSVPDWANQLSDEEWRKALSERLNLSKKWSSLASLSLFSHPCQFLYSAGWPAILPRHIIQSIYILPAVEIVLDVDSHVICKLGNFVFISDLKGGIQYGVLFKRPSRGLRHIWCHFSIVLDLKSRLLSAHKLVELRSVQVTTGLTTGLQEPVSQNTVQFIYVQLGQHLVQNH